MDPITSGSGANPTNNPRLDLLHNAGDNQQLNGAAGSYGPAKAPAPTPVAIPRPAAPSPAVPRTPATAPAAASSYVAAAQANRPAPVPRQTVPTQAPVAPSAQRTMPNPSMPQPRPAAPMRPVPSGTNNQSGGGKKIAIIIGVLILLVVLAIGGYFAWKATHKESAPVTTAPAEITDNASDDSSAAAVAPSNPVKLEQKSAAGTAIATGTSTEAHSITFEFTMDTTATTGAATPEIEVQPVGTAFTGTPTKSGAAIPATGKALTASITVDSLVDGNYHWQARFKTDAEVGNWTAASQISGTSFTVKTAAAAAAPAATPTPTPTATATPAASAAPASTTPAVAASTGKLAATGDSTTSRNLASLLIMVAAGLGWLGARRYARR